MRNETDVVGIRHEAQKAQHEAGRIKHDADRIKIESVRIKEEAARLRNEVIRNEVEERRMRHYDQPTRRDHSGSRSGRDGGISVISRADLTEEQGESSRGQHHHHHHHHHQAHLLQHQDYELHHDHDDNDTKRGAHGYGRGGRGGREGRGGRGGRGSGRGGEGGRGRGGGRGTAGGREEHDSDHNSRLDVDSQSSSTRPTRPSHTMQSGKLFDPRKDDPVRFASLRTKYGMFPLASTLSSLSLSNTSIGASSTSDIRSLTSLDQSTNASSEGKERRRRRGPSSRTTNESGDGRKDIGHNTNSYVVELKRCYREIASLELKLQEEHRSMCEKQRLEQAESSSIASNRASSNRIGYKSRDELDHQYWYDLTAQHRQLAETHAAFMEAALRPGLPSSLHSLPQNYNIPTRLWHTGFHVLLQRLCQTLPSMSSNTTNVAATIGEADTTTKQMQNEMTDILVEFIYFAYSFYSNLLESETFRSFRSSWIENLGDLARYRMAVAKVVAKEEAASRQKDKDFKRETLVKPGSIPPDDDEEYGHGSGKGKGSVGSGALHDWDLEEKEVWRSTARNWYAKGLAEMPGIGRLHHHLGILSRDDELRALHHFCKSLTSSHPYLKARESILPLFERDLQIRRLQADASLIDLFIYLHGLLFSKIQLDDFEEVFARFKIKLQLIAGPQGDPSAKAEAKIGQSAWMMMATINIASMLQYSTEGLDQTPAVKTVIATPANTEELTAEALRMEEDDEDVTADGAGEEEIKGPDAQPSAPVQSSSTEDKPITLHYSARLTFTILSTLTSAMNARPRQSVANVNPYVTMLLTFVSQECKQSTLLDIMEPHIPWDQLLGLGGRIPSSLEPIDPRKDIALRIRGDGGPLGEDWCLRGMAWVGRRIYERGFWKSPRTTGAAGRSYTVPPYESEVEVLDRYATCTADLKGSDSSADDQSEDTGDEDEDQTGGCSAEATTVSMLRWKRLVYTLTILIKTVPGLDFDAKTGKLILTSPLLEKIDNWRLEQEIGAQQKIRLQASDTKTKEDGNAAVTDGEDEDDDDDLDREDDTENVRNLKRRRRVLRQQIRESRLAMTDRPKFTGEIAPPKQRPQPADRHPFRKLSFLAGYTILVLDTNVMLTPVSVLEQLVESKKWCTVIPLVTVTELEGLTKRPGIIGQRAQKAIDYLSANLKSKTTYLKVQTSRGNYLTDLRFRNEDIDFSSIPATTSSLNRGGGDKGDVGKEDEDGKHKVARSIDEVIVYCLEWQVKSFIDKSAILLKDHPQELERTRSQITKDTFKAALITLDLNLRLKARFRGFTAVGPKTLIDVLEPAVPSST